MAESDGIPMHKKLAMGEALPEGTFGVPPFSATCAGGGMTKTNTIIPDHQRAAGLPVGGNQANPDHGFPK